MHLEQIASQFREHIDWDYQWNRKSVFYPIWN